MTSLRKDETAKACQILSYVRLDSGVVLTLHCRDYDSCRLAAASGWWQLAGQALELSMRASGIKVKHHIILTPGMDSNATILDALAAVKGSALQGKPAAHSGSGLPDSLCMPRPKKALAFFRLLW